jgi:cytochrome c-type biogenesis protein CcmF
VFLGFLAIALLFSLGLLAFRLDAITAEDTTSPAGLTRDTAFAFNNMLFSAFTFMVLMGTVYPLLNEAITGTQISVGQPWFDRWGAPIGLSIVFLMGVGPALPWGRAATPDQLRRVGVAAGVGALVAGICAAAGLRSAWPLATFGLSAFALVVTLDAMLAPARARAQARGEALGQAALVVARSARRRYGGYIVHIGVLMVVVAHAAATAYQTRETLTLKVGESGTAGDYTLTYEGAAWQEQPHRRSLVATFALADTSGPIGQVTPRLNHYRKMGTPIGTPEVRSGLRHDLYFSLVNVDEKAGFASIDVHDKPMVIWLWLGGLVMVFGTVISAWPSRRSSESVPPAAATLPQPAVGV